MSSRLLALTFLAVLAFPCLTVAAEAPSTDIYLWPLLVVDKDESGSQVSVLGPVAEFRNKDGEIVRAIRPLYALRKRADGRRSVDIVWPIFNLRRDEDGYRSGRLVPAYWGAEEDGDRHFGIAPVLWSWWNKERRATDEHGLVVPPVWNVGEYGKGGDYSHGIAPLWCSWREGVEHGTWLFPVYWDSNDNDPSERSLLIVPFFGQWYDGNLHDTWVLPVYWAKDGDDTTALVIFPVYWQMKHSEVIFPFYWNVDDGAAIVFFPFWGRLQGKTRNWQFFLWPLYTGTQRGDYEGHKVLWPILTWGSNDDKSELRYRFWPLFGTSRKSWDDRMRKRSHALWPLFWWGQSETSAGGYEYGEGEERRTYPPRMNRRKHFNIFPIYWSGERHRLPTTTVSTGEDGETVTEQAVEESHKYHNHLLPLYTYTRDDEERWLTLIWPLWRYAHREEADRYSVLWRLFDARYFGDGNHKVNVLWRGFRDHEAGDVRKVDVFPFTTYRREKGVYKRFQFLAGLFEYGKRDDARYLRLLYSPKIPLGGS